MPMKNSAIKPKAQQTILIADDSRVVRKAVSTILCEKYSIIEAENGERALAILADNPHIDILLLDLWMPDVDGFEVLETLRNSELPWLKILPVIIITGHEDDSEMRHQAETLGATDYIGKPFSPVELRESIHKQLQSADSANVVPLEHSMASIDDTQTTQPIPKIGTHSAAEIRHSRERFLHREGSKRFEETIKTQRSFSIIHFQVDRVKSLLHTTDTEFTKRSLYRIHKLIEGESRHKDLLVRIGPADFVLAMPNTELDEARDIAKHIYHSMCHTAFQYDGLKFRLSLSSGLATHKAQRRSQFDTLLALACARQEKAHSSGGDQLIYVDIKPNVTPDTPLITLDEAVNHLRSGDTNIVKPQLLRLLSKCMPLLVYANARLDLNIDHAIKHVHSLIDPNRDKL